MKRLGVLVLLTVFAVSLSAQTLKDGKYFAQQDGFGSSGWKSQVVLEVKGGKITAANWNGVSNIAGAADKKSYDKAGKYNMVKFGKAQAEWYQQAEKVEQYLVKTQDYKFNKYSDAEGHTDAISGASIHVKEFFDLAQKAIAAGPVAKGMYAKDGWYYAEQADFDKQSGWKDTVLVTVVNGRIVDVVWNGISNDSAKKSKIVESVSGNYNMVKFGKAQAEWHEQAAKAQAALIAAQDPAKITVNAEGKTDAITGVSIHVGPFLQLVTTALKAAK
ncbi:MAG: FMN-binding protein [Spirochaetota bacterium]|uniref:FMN-binding protein n=1 Tax=Gracilinema caldarium TaxID=215591 RepID=A0A7C3EAX8_9SPIR